MFVEEFASNGHVGLEEGVLQHIVGVNFIDRLQNLVHFREARCGCEYKLCSYKDSGDINDITGVSKQRKCTKKDTKIIRWVPVRD